jgi:hypothetical protein
MTMRPGSSCLLALSAAAAGVLLAGGACDLESLRSSALYPRQEADAGATIDATPDTGSDGATDTDATVPGADASADLSAATGMLSGTVRSSCGGAGIDALVGIGGRHTCSYPDKGSYFFPRLPVGALKLTAAKAGYALYEATIVIAAGGNIHDIQLDPADPAGCGTVPAPPVACTCTTSTCEP